MHFLLTFVLCLIISLMQLTNSSEPGNKDGFNFYKDYLRGKSDEIPISSDTEGDRVLYFYRTPALLVPNTMENLQERDFGKRTTNTFKNHMLSKDTMLPEYGPSIQKRITDSVLSWLLANEKLLYKDTDQLAEDKTIGAH